MVVLGGVGSLWGMVLGSFVITIIPEVLRPDKFLVGIPVQQVIFYGALLALMAVLIRPRIRFFIVLGSVIVGGLIVRLLAAALIPDQISTDVPNIIQRWLVMPADANVATALGNFVFFIVTGLFVLLAIVPKRYRDPLLVLALYLLVFVWETRLSQEPSTTVLLITGVALIILMNYRPQGLLGQRRVEIV
jgi:ABC-type branched-subunit amino acid transport system permease subunit